MFNLSSRLQQLTAITAFSLVAISPTALAENNAAAEANLGLETAASARQVQQLGQNVSDTARHSAHELRDAMGGLVRQQVGNHAGATVNAEVAAQVSASVGQNARDSLRQNVRDNVRGNVRDNVRDSLRDDVRPGRGRGGN